MLRELALFMMARKKFWLLPVLVVMIAIGALLVVAENSVLAPFIYTLF